jgi:hypothetical protein
LEKVESPSDREDIVCLSRGNLGYIERNGGNVPNYGERRRYGEVISTSFAESTVNAVVSKRFCKKQQMQWTPGERTCYCKPEPEF